MSERSRRTFRSRFGMIVSTVFYAAVIALVCFATINLFQMWLEEYSTREPVQRSVR